MDSASPELPTVSYPMIAEGPMTVAQAATLKKVAQAAYALDAFKPNLTPPRRINASRC